MEADAAVARGDDATVQAVGGVLDQSAQPSALSDEQLNKRIAEHQEELKQLEHELSTRNHTKKRKRIEDEANKGNETKKLSNDQLLGIIMEHQRDLDVIKNERKLVHVDVLKRLFEPAADHMRAMSKHIFEHHRSLLRTFRQQENQLQSYRDAVREILNNKAQDDPQTRTAIAERLATIWERSGGTWGEQEGKSWSEQLEEDILQEREQEIYHQEWIFEDLQIKRIPSDWKKPLAIADVYGWERKLLENLRTETVQLFANVSERLKKLEALDTKLFDVRCGLDEEIEDDVFKALIGED
jgi:uncharacterized small protein (DUF1192 family)